MDKEVEELLECFREITKIDSRHDFVEDGFYKGCTIHYSNGMTMFHPYIPLTMIGCGMEEYSSGYPVYADMLLERSSGLDD